MKKTALVTGSTRGIGAAIADALSESGYLVFRNSRTGGDIPADLSTLAGANMLADTVMARCDKLDCLVLNAGATCRMPFAEMSFDEWQDVMNTNVNMPLFLIQQLFDKIVDGGSIIFISSAMSLKPHATSLAYGVTKAAVNALAQNLVKEFAPRGIRVNVICPGFIDTEWQKEKPAWLRSKIESKIALKRFGTPEEVAEMCLNLVQNAYINGAIVSVDGGYDME